MQEFPKKRVGMWDQKSPLQTLFYLYSSFHPLSFIHPLTQIYCSTGCIQKSALSLQVTCLPKWYLDLLTFRVATSSAFGTFIFQTFPIFFSFVCSAVVIKISSIICTV